MGSKIEMVTYRIKSITVHDEDEIDIPTNAISITIDTVENEWLMIISWLEEVSKGEEEEDMETTISK